MKMKPWNVALVLLGLLIIAAGFYFFQHSPGAPQGGDGDSPPRRDEVRRISLILNEGKLEPREISVSQGTALVLSLIPLESGELHLHTYGLELVLERGEKTEISLTASRAGRHEWEFHGKSGETVAGVLTVTPASFPGKR